MAQCDTQHAGKEIVTRPMSEYFANDPECHELLPCALRSHRVAGLGGCPTGPPVGGVTSTSTPALWPCAVLWPCTFCSDRMRGTGKNQKGSLKISRHNPCSPFFSVSYSINGKPS